MTKEVNREKEIYKVTLWGSFVNFLLLVLKFVAGFVGATPVVRDLANKVSGKRIGAVLEPILLIVLLLICTGYLVDGSFSPFLYFRF